MPPVFGGGGGGGGSGGWVRGVGEVGIADSGRLRRLTRIFPRWLIVSGTPSRLSLHGVRGLLEQTAQGFGHGRRLATLPFNHLCILRPRLKNILGGGAGARGGFLSPRFIF